MDSSTSLFGQVHFQFKGYLAFFSVTSFIIEILVLNANSIDHDRVLRRLIRDYTVCQCPVYGTPDINGLRSICQK